MKVALTIREATAAAGVGRTTLYTEISSGRLAAKKMGRRTLIMAEDLQAWLDSLPPVVPSKTGGALKMALPVRRT